MWASAHINFNGEKYEFSTVGWVATSTVGATIA
jgi:hypothetical protein